MSDFVSQDSGASSEEDRALQEGAATRYGRRALMLGAAAAGAGITLSLVGGAKPADASNGGSVLLGKTNTASDSTIVNTTNGNGFQGQTSQTGSSGVYGIDKSPGGGYGIQGNSTNGTAVSASITNSASPAAALAASTNGTGIAVEVTITNEANSNPAVSALTNGSGPGVHGESTGSGFGVVGSSAKTFGVVGVTTSGIGGVLAGGPSGVVALGIGTGYGVKATDTAYGSKELSTPVFAQVANLKNGSPAVDAWNGGTGSAVRAMIDNAKNSSPAVAVTTNGTGNAIEASITDAASTQSAVSALTKGKGSGVFGKSSNAAGHGVMGQGTSGAAGLYGSSDSGAGVYAKSTSGNALEVVGKVSFSRSGLASVAAKKTSVKVTSAGVTTSSMILATLQTDAGAVAVANAVPATGSFTIKLTAAPTKSVKVAWMVLG